MKPSRPEVSVSFYLIDFKWLPDGLWRYYMSTNDIKDRYWVEVPLAANSLEWIEYLDPDTAQKTLGGMTCPTSNLTKALERMPNLTNNWVDMAIEGKLSWRDVWFMVTRQFWPSVGYGIGCNTANMKHLEEVLQKQYYQLLPFLGGYIRSAPTELF